METINQYAIEGIHAYINGSAFVATLNTGNGAVTIYPNFHHKDNQRIRVPCEQYCSNYTAEITGIKMVLCKILVDFENGSITSEDIVVFSDSKSAHTPTPHAIDKGLSTVISNIQQLVN
jgi:ribonuclease HI